MGIQITTTQEQAKQNGVKMLVYGGAGAGKTYAIRTLPRPLVISAESGLLSLADVNLPVVKIASIKELKSVYEWVINSSEAKDYDSLALDSLSEIAEIYLQEILPGFKDGRQAYADLIANMEKIIRAFRDLPEKHVYFTCKLSREKDEVSGAVLNFPSMPGKALSQRLPYFFDQVFYAHSKQSADLKTIEYFYQTKRDYQSEAKNRGGKLNFIENQNLSQIIEKIFN